MRGEITDVDVGDIKIQNTRVRYYIPASVKNNCVMIYLHGGGFALGSPEAYENACKYIAKKAGIKILSLDYRLAPEHVFPSAVNECLQVCHLILSEGVSQKLNIKNTDKFIFCGDSAGGGLAAVMTHELIEKHRNILAQILVYPVTLPVGATPSYEQYKEGFFLTKHMMVWFMDAYVDKKTENTNKNPQIYPHYYNNFPQLPKTFVLNAECDTLRDEGFLYAKKCEDFGVDISHYEYQGLIHGFLPHLGAYSEAYDACDLISEFITKLN